MPRSADRTDRACKRCRWRRRQPCSPSCVFATLRCHHTITLALDVDAQALHQRCARSGHYALCESGFAQSRHNRLRPVPDEPCVGCHVQQGADQSAPVQPHACRVPGIGHSRRGIGENAETDAHMHGFGPVRVRRPVTRKGGGIQRLPGQMPQAVAVVDQLAARSVSSLRTCSARSPMPCQAARGTCGTGVGVGRKRLSIEREGKSGIHGSGHAGIDAGGSA